MALIKVRNNHAGLLAVAGVTVRPGATVGVDPKQFDIWKTGNAAKIWLQAKIIEVIENPVAPAPVVKAAPKSSGIPKGVPAATVIPKAPSKGE